MSFSTGPTSRVRRAFTIVELLVVMGIIGLMVALSLPAIQAARETARCNACGNNVRQIGLALLNFESVHNSLPVGSRSAGHWGMCWCVDCLPYLDEANLYNKLDVTSPNCGWLAMAPQNGDAVDGVAIGAFTCPSTPLDTFWPVDGRKVQMPSFVGIAGAANYDGFSETRVSTCCLPRNDGQISGGGVLIPNRGIHFMQVSDGLSNTMAVAECSDFAVDSSGAQRRIDGSFPRGWPTGTNALGIPPNYQKSNPPAAYNLTTIRYTPNTRNYSQPGIYVDHGANNPLVAAHRGGVNSVFLDGSVRFLSETIDLLTLKQFATRDDQRTSGALP